MTKQMKDVFDLPLSRFNNMIHDKEHCIDIRGQFSTTLEQLDCVVEAINNHDTLTEQNKQLVEANKELCAMLAKWYKADFTDPMLGITELKSATWDAILNHNN